MIKDFVLDRTVALYTLAVNPFEKRRARIVVTLGSSHDP